MVKIKKVVFSIVMLLFIAVVFAMPRSVYAATPVSITRPEDGSKVSPGKVGVYTTFVYSGESISDFASKISPMTVQVLNNSGKVIETNVWNAGTGQLDLIDTHRMDVNIPSEGVYTIRASVPGSPNEWSSVKITASGINDEEDTGKDSDDEWPEGTRDWNIVPSDKNPGYHVSVEKSVYNIDTLSNNVARINFTLSVDKAVYEKDENHFYFSSDRVSKAGESLVKFKNIENKGFVLKGDKYINEYCLEYRGVKEGVAKMQLFFLANGSWYDKHELTINITGQKAAGEKTSGKNDSQTGSKEEKTSDTKASKKSTALKNPMTVKAKTVKLKAKNLQKKKQVIAAKKALSIKKAVGKLTFKKLKGNKKITVSKTGKITAQKKLKKGTYKLVLKVTAAGNDKYKKISKKVTVKIKVK